MKDTGLAAEADPWPVMVSGMLGVRISVADSQMAVIAIAIDLDCMTQPEAPSPLGQLRGSLFPVQLVFSLASLPLFLLLHLDAGQSGSLPECASVRAYRSCVSRAPVPRGSADWVARELGGG